MGAQLDLLAAVVTDAQVLEREAEALGEAEIDVFDATDALDQKLIGADAAVERQHADDRQLLGGVMALDVERRVRLGVAELLRLRERSRKRQACLTHAREDIVASTVEDGVHARYRV